MGNPPPQFNSLSQIDEEILVAKLQAARKAISHAGEKGRTLEKEVSSILRSFLPSEYGLSTGFIVYHSEDGPKLSPQLDIIIHDQIRCSPIVRLATCDVFPLEAVYGYIEVKATLQSSSDNAQKYADNSIERCLENNKKLRTITKRRYWRPIADSVTDAELLEREWMPLRGYVFSFEAQGATAQDPSRFAQRMASFSSQLSSPTHLHGVFIAGKGYFATRPVDPRTAKKGDYYHITFTTQNPLAAFKWSLLHSLARFPRFSNDWAPAVDQYHQGQGDWQVCNP